MIYYMLQGHDLQNDVQTMVQVFYPNLHYYRIEIPELVGITVCSVVEENTVYAVYYNNGIQKAKWSVPYTEELSVSEKKRLVKLSIFG